MAAVWYFQPAISWNQFAADRHLAEEARKELYCGHHPDDFLDVHDALGDVPAGLPAMGLVRGPTEYAALRVWRHHFRFHHVDHFDGGPSIKQKSRS